MKEEKYPDIPGSEHPCRVVYRGDETRAHLHRGDGTRTLAGLKTIQRQGGDVRSLRNLMNDGTVIKAHTHVDGMDVVFIDSPPAGAPPTIVTEEIQTKSLVAIIDCESGRACFDIVEKEGTDGWLGLCDFIPEDAIQYNTKDPVAPRTFQPTWRDQWYDRLALYLETGDENEGSRTVIQIVQCQRVDGGYKSYDGDPWDWEDGGLYSTLIEHSDNIWDDERPSYCPYIMGNFSMTPGYPTGDDLDVFEYTWPGWTWSWCEDEFYNIFASIDVGTRTTWWYPREFNQHVIFNYAFQILNCTNIATSESFDSRGWPSTHHFTEAESTSHEYHDRRGWQCWPNEDPLSYDVDSRLEAFYGNMYSTVDQGTGGFPYTSPAVVPMQDEYAEEYIGMHGEGWYGDGGVYVDHALEYFFFMGASWAPYGWDQTGYMMNERLPVDVDFHFRGGTSELTANELVLIEGNWDNGLDWKYPGFWGYNHSMEAGEDTVTYYPFTKGIYCEEKFYPEFAAVAVTTDTWYGNSYRHRTYYKYDTSTPDLGIFTTGVYDAPGDEIKAEELVYAYSLIDYEEGEVGRFGVLLGKEAGNRTHLYSPWYPADDGNFSIPEVADVLDCKALPSITIGVKTTTITTWRKVDAP